MSDLAMTAEPSNTPAPPPVDNTPEPVETPNPIRTDAPPKEPEQPEKPKSVRDSVVEAKAKIEKQEADKSKDEAKGKPVENKAPERQRGEGGKFAPRDQQQNGQQVERQDGQQEQDAQARPSQHKVPDRFSPEAKADWEKAPEHVRSEVARMERELTQGVERYRQPAEIYDRHFKPFVELAQSANIDPVETLQGYVQLDRLVQKDLVAGLDAICQSKGFTLNDVVAHLTGQPRDQQSSQQDRTISELRNEISQLKQQFGGINSTVTNWKQSAVENEVESFRSSLPEEDRSLIDELDNEIGTLIANEGLSLADAFAKAKGDVQQRFERMFGSSGLRRPDHSSDAGLRRPAPSSAQGAQTPKGSRSIAGAPGAGSDPVTKGPAPSISEAVKRAMARVG